MGIDYTKFTFTVYDDNHNIISIEKINDEDEAAEYLASLYKEYYPAYKEAGHVKVTKKADCVSVTNWRFYFKPPYSGASDPLRTAISRVERHVYGATMENMFKKCLNILEQDPEFKRILVAIYLQN